MSLHARRTAPGSLPLRPFLLYLLLCLAAAASGGEKKSPLPERAESLYRKQLWADAEKELLAFAVRTADKAAAAAAFQKAGTCRLKQRDEKGALDLFAKITGDPAAVKAAPDVAAAAFDQSHAILLGQGKHPARERLLEHCRKALPAHPVNARLAEREGDARLATGAADRALACYTLAGAGLSPTGTNALRLLSARDTGLSSPPLSEADAAALALLGAEKPACGLALCRLLSKRKEGWRAEDTRARILAEQKRFAEAAAVWEALLKSGQGPADRLGLALAETVGFKSGDFARAAVLYGEWLKRHPASPLREKAEYQRAGVLWMSGDFAGAAAAFEAFLSAHPDGPYAGPARETLSRARADLANRDKAAARAAVEAGDPLAADLARAERSLRGGDHAEALRLFSRFRGRQAHSQWGRAWYGYGLCRRALGELGKALDVWDEVLRQSSLFTNTLRTAECRLAKADTWLEDLADPAKALEAYDAARAALPPLPPDPALERGRALALLALGRGAEARPLLEAFRAEEAADPLRVLHWDGLLALCDAQGPLPEARTPEERRAAALLRVADVHFAAERWDKAAGIYRKAAGAAPGTEAEAFAHMQRARCVARGNKPEKALPIYNLFRKEHAKSVWADDALLRAGVLCAGPLGDPERGAEYFRELLSTHPDGDRAETARLYLATLAWWTGKWAEAERLHKAFMERYPESPFLEEFLTVRLPAIAARKATLAGGGTGKETGR